MNTVTQKMKFRQSLINYANKHGVTKAAIKYNVNRQYVYRWKKRYDGTIQSLADKSHKPFQGAGRKVIIFSTTYGGSESCYFINNNNLMNVAVSRAKDAFGYLVVMTV